MNIKFTIIGETASTNELAKELAVDDVIFVFSAVSQYAGKGRGSNHWFSKPGKNLTFSIQLKPKNLKAEKQFYLSAISALSIKKLLEFYLSDISVKWPNDIYFRDLKISGMLIENCIEGEYISNSVIGIGLNVNQEDFNQSHGAACSLAGLTKRQFNMDALLSRLVLIFRDYIRLLNSGSYDAIKAEYESSLFQVNKSMKFQNGEQEFNAVINGVDEFGRIGLKAENSGVITYYGMDEITMLVHKK